MIIEDNKITLEKNEIIFKEGSYERCMYDIEYGRVGIYAKFGTPEEKNLAVLKESEYFGEMGLIESYPRSATAIALDEGTVITKITAENFGTYFKNKPGKILDIMEQTSHRLRTLTDDYMEACKTITEYLEAEEKGEKKSEGLLAKMRKFMQFYKDRH